MKSFRRSGRDSIEVAMRQRVRETIEAIVEEELEAALGAREVGARRRRAPGLSAWDARADADDEPGTDDDRDAAGARASRPTGTSRRMAQRDDARAISADSSASTKRFWASTWRARNTRRIKGALAPLLRGGPLSKDAVSRLVGRLREDFETWRTRDLADEDIRYVFMDGWYPKVRIGGRRERVPVLVTLGVRANGERVVLDMRLVGEESAASWTRGGGQSRGAAPGAAGLGDDRRQSGPDERAAIALAGHRDSTLHRP